MEDEIRDDPNLISWLERREEEDLDRLEISRCAVREWEDPVVVCAPGTISERCPDPRLS